MRDIFIKKRKLVNVNNSLYFARQTLLTNAAFGVWIRRVVNCSKFEEKVTRKPAFSHVVNIQREDNNDVNASFSFNYIMWTLNRFVLRILNLFE